MDIIKRWISNFIYHSSLADCSGRSGSGSRVHRQQLHLLHFGRHFGLNLGLDADKDNGVADQDEDERQIEGCQDGEDQDTKGHVRILAVLVVDGDGNAECEAQQPDKDYDEDG